MTINKYLNRDIYVRLSEIRQFETYSQDHKNEIINFKLKEVLEYSMNNSIFYKEKLRDYNPHDVNIENLYILPITTKKELKESYSKNLTRKVAGKDIIVSSGGTTGIPFKYALSRDQYCSERGVLLLAWEKAGFRIGDRVGYLDNVALSGRLIGIKNKLRNIYPKSMYEVNEKNVKDYLDYYYNNRIEWLRIVPSSMYEFVKLSKKIGINSFDSKYLKGIFSTGEMLYDFQRNEIEDFFKVKIYSQYSSGDGGQCAYQTLDSGDLYEVGQYRSIFEIVEGKVIATLLDRNPLFPFIRYEVGDLAEFNDPKYIDNKIFIKNIIGRTFQSIILKDGTFIQGLYFVHLFDGTFDIVDNFMFLQKDIENLYVYVVLKDSKAKDYIKTKILEKMEISIKERINIHFEFVDFIEKDTKKFIYVKREFDPSL